MTINDTPIDTSDIEVPDLQHTLRRHPDTPLLNSVLSGYSKRRLRKLRTGWPDVTSLPDVPPPDDDSTPAGDNDPAPVDGETAPNVEEYEPDEEDEPEDTPTTE